MSRNSIVDSICLILMVSSGAVVAANENPRISPLQTKPTESTLGYVNTPIEHYCTNDPAESLLESREDQASGRGRRPLSPSPFFNSTMLHIELNVPNDTCQASCRAALTQALIKSLALWRSGCGRCMAERLIAIAIGENVWLDNVTIDKWRHALTQNMDRATQDPKQIGRMSLRPLGFQPIVDFRRIVPGTDKGLCEAARRYATSADLAQAVCANTAVSCGSPSCLSLPVHVGHAENCSLTGRLACGSADGEIALNTEDYAYSYPLERIGPPEVVTFGNGTETVDLFPVLLHETGHWFGLDHEREDVDLELVSIMRIPFSPRKRWCVTEWNLTQVDNAVDRNWDFRLGGSHGLERASE